jgi:hypothetical protein
MAASTWDSRSCCCSRHTAYSNLGLAVLLLITAHSLFKLGAHGPAVAHGTQPIRTWDSRPCCCSRHTVYSYLGLAVLMLLTAHSLYTLGTHGPAKHHLCYSKRYFYSYSKHIVGLSFPSGRRTRAAFAHSHLCTLFLEHLCTLCLRHLCTLCLENLCTLSLGIVAYFSFALSTAAHFSFYIVAHFALGRCARYLGSLCTLP